MAQKHNNRQFPDTIDYQGEAYRFRVAYGSGALSYYHPQVEFQTNANEFPHLTISKDVNALQNLIAFHVTGIIVRNPEIRIEYNHKGGRTNSALGEGEFLLYHKYYILTIQGPNASALADRGQGFVPSVEKGEDSNLRRDALEKYIKENEAHLPPFISGAVVKEFSEAFQEAIDEFMPEQQPQPQHAAAKPPATNAWGKLSPQVLAPKQNPAPKNPA